MTWESRISESHKWHSSCKKLTKQVENKERNKYLYSLQLVYKYRSTKVPKWNRNAQHEQHTSETVLPEEERVFEREMDVDQEMIIRPSHAPTSMYVPYIEGPKMNWTVDDSV